jgi:hypothetical protein
LAVDLLTNPSGLMRIMAGYAEFMSKLRTLLTTTIPKDSGAIDRLMDEYAADRSYGPRVVETFLNWRSYQVDVFLETMRQHALATLVQKVMDEADNPPGRPDPVECLRILIEEMRDTPNDVNACTVAVGAEATPLGTNVGNGKLVWTVTRPDGQAAENLYNETLFARCVRDSYSGRDGTGADRAIAGSETWRVWGQQPVPNPFHENWAATGYGSGADILTQSVNPRVDNALGQVLTNGDLEDWTGATPDHWGKTDAQNQISQTTTSGEYHDGSSGLKITGHAAGTPEWWQEFNNTASGSGHVFKPRTNYALIFYGRVSATGPGPATGVLTASVTDSANSALTSEFDTTGFSGSPTSQSTTFDMTAWTTSFVAKTATFRLKRNLSTVRLHFKVTTALEAGFNAFIDRIALAEMTPCVPSVGPWLSVFSGTTDWVYKDNFSQAFTNNRAGASNLNTFQTVLFRLFMRELIAGDLIFPSDTGGTETVADSLITA